MEKLLEKIEELNGKLEKAVAAGESVAELKAELKKLQEDYVAMKQEMGEIKKAAPSKASLPGVELEKNQFSFLRAISAITTKNWKNAGFELEVFQNTAGSKDGVAKTMSTEVDSAGGYTVPIQVLGDFIEMLRANLIVRALGATYIEGLVGSPVEVPGQLGGATTIWLGEDHPTGLTATDISLKMQGMMPHMCGTIVKMSNRLLRMSSNPSIENLVRSDVALSMADAMDKAFLYGTGADAQPLGVMNVSGVLTHSLSGLTKKVELWNALYEMENKLAEANSLKGKLGFAWHPRVRKYLQQSRVGSGFAAEDGAGQFVADPIGQHHLQSFIGYPYQQTTNLPIDTTANPDNTDIIFGNWAELIVGVWQGLTILASQEASNAFTLNQTWIRFVQEVDCMVRHKESFCLGTNLNVETLA